MMEKVICWIIQREARLNRRRLAKKPPPTVLMLLLTVSFVFTMPVFTIDPVVAQLETKLTVTDNGTGNYFGDSVAISEDGTTVVIGAYRINNDKGAADVFAWDRAAWGKQARLTALDRTDGDRFGVSVAISGDGGTMVVGAYGDDGNKGAAYVFTWDGTAWSQHTKLLASNRAAYDRFGWSVAISGRTVVVGAPRWEFAEDKTRPEAVYVYAFEPPVAEDMSVTGDEDTTIAWTPVVSDPDSEVLSCSIVTPPAHGSVWVAANGSEGTYTPDPDYNGIDSFTYEVSDEMTTDTGTVTVTVKSVNDAPIAEVGGPYTGTAGIPITFDASGSVDLDGDPLQYRWDFDGDGTWDTAYSPEPTVTYTYEETYSGDVLMEVFDGSTTNSASSTATIIAPITVTMSDVEAEVALFPDTLGILPLAILTGALVVLVLHRKRKHRSVN